MLTLINSNRMTPPIAPVGLDYVAGAARQAGLEVDVLDLCLADDPDALPAGYFADHRPDLVGLSFRNVDDCFWPGGAWFVPELEQLVKQVRAVSDAPIVIGGVGFSIYPEAIVRHTGVDFGIHGDGERAIIQLHAELLKGQRFERVDGLIWRADGRIRSNRPAWPDETSQPRPRDAVDNATYFRLGGQLGLETKRGCNRTCIYCPEPKIKGSEARLRTPQAVADEVESLLAQGVDVLHLCDSEFNIPPSHAREVCEEFIRRRFDRRLRWYTYMTVVPLDDDLAKKMRRAGCVGINFTGDAGCPEMLRTSCEPHGQADLAQAVRLCRENGITVMLDLLLGGPGETPQTVEQSIRFIQRIDPDCAGAALGVRLYPGTAIASMLAAEGPLESNPAIHRRYEGPIDLLRPTFFVSSALGERPSQLIRDLIGGDPRFFEPADDVLPTTEQTDQGSDYNYNQNQVLADAISGGARGAYWDVLRRLRSG